MIVLGRAGRLARTVAAQLIEAGFHVRHVVPAKADCVLPGGVFEADLSTDESVKRLHRLLTGREGIVVGSIINLRGVEREEATASSATAVSAETTSLFRVVREFLPDLVGAAEEGGGWVLNVTALDGKFGCDAEANGPLDFATAGSIGLFKSLAREQPKLHVKNVDVAPRLLAADEEESIARLAERLVDEFRRSDSQLEIGLTEQERFRLAVRETDAAILERRSSPLTSDSVVLITGGAYGVTADAARAVARNSQARLILVGRSSLPEAESNATSGLDAGGLRKHFIAEAKASGVRALPSEIERSVQRLLRDRRILATIDDLRRSGSAVEYHAVDVRDAAAFGRLIDDVYARHGRLDGVVHGAGVIEDKLIPDKTPDSFSRVFGTKVDAAMILAERLRPKSLKFVVFFSSVSGRLGNLGQSDYSAANEVLNKWAAATRGRWFDGRPWSGRAVALNWGPWDAGMISDELRKLYAARDIGLIPVDEGIAAFLDELQFVGPPEVVLASWPASMFDAIQGGFLKA